MSPGHELMDLAGPLSAFRTANALSEKPLYDLRVVSESGGDVVGNSSLPLRTTTFRDGRVDTVVFVGGEIAPLRSSSVIEAAKRLASKAVRVTSVCTGAFLLADAGFLDGRRATTHWATARELQQAHPSIRVEPDNIFVKDGHIWTSAGVAAGIDLALALIEADHGVDLAREVSRYLVVPHRRPGGQSQFSTMSELDPDSERIRLALAFAQTHLTEPLPVERLAEAAKLSVRQFARAFRRETGVTPAKAIERMRVEVARLRLETGSESIEQIARAVGFADPERMRRAFVKLHGHPPQAIRRATRIATSQASVALPGPTS